jgi:hypothetical protein
MAEGRIVVRRIREPAVKFLAEVLCAGRVVAVNKFFENRQIGKESHLAARLLLAPV